MNAVHQLLIGASSGDAITSMALNIRNRLRAKLDSEIFAAFIDPTITSDIRPIQELYQFDQSYGLIYHASYGLERVTQFLATFAGPLVVNYHNITPAHFFDDIDTEFAAGLRWGRKELELIRDKVRVAVADSTFNANELATLGYKNVVVCPAGVENDRLTRLVPDIRISNHYKRLFPNGYIVTLSQLLPHKSVHEVVASVHFLNQIVDQSIGLIVIGVARSGNYSVALRGYAENLLGSNCCFAGKLNDRQVATLVRDALAYTSMSKHEGLSLPLIEAMSLGTPAIVRSAGAIRETAGSGALVLDERAGPVEMAHALKDVILSTSNRSKWILQGLKRSKDFQSDAMLERYDYVLSEVSL